MQPCECQPKKLGVRLQRMGIFSFLRKPLPTLPGKYFLWKRIRIRSKRNIQKYSTLHFKPFQLLWWLSHLVCQIKWQRMRYALLEKLEDPVAAKGILTFPFCRQLILLRKTWALKWKSKLLYAIFLPKIISALEKDAHSQRTRVSNSFQLGGDWKTG